MCSLYRKTTPTDDWLLRRFLRSKVAISYHTELSQMLYIPAVQWA
jgi:hypothetical protein